MVVPSVSAHKHVYVLQQQFEEMSYKFMVNSDLCILTIVKEGTVLCKCSTFLVNYLDNHSPDSSYEVDNFINSLAKIDPIKRLIKEAYKKR